MKKLGIIGGMGPMATADLYRRVIELTPADSDQEPIETWIGSVPQIPDRTGYLLGTSSENPLPKMVEVGKSLRDQGAEILAIPCITAHAFHSELEEGIGIPVIHPIRELAELCRICDVRKLGVMATDGAKKAGIYDEVLSDYGVACIWPDEKGQKDVMSMIYNDVKAGGMIGVGTFGRVAKDLFDRGSEAIVLGCTELSQAKYALKLDARYFNIIDVLAEACVRECLEEE